VAVTIRCQACGRVYHVRADGEITEIACSCGATVPVPVVERAADAPPRRIEPAPPPPPPPPPEASATEVHAVVAPAPAAPVVEATPTPETLRAARRLRIAIVAATLAGGVLAWAAGLTGDLSAALWSVALPQLPAWTWFVAPVAGLVAVFLICPKRRAGSLAGTAAVVAGTLASFALMLLLHRVLTFAWRPIAREALGGLTWSATWPLVGAGGAATTAALAPWLGRIIPAADATSPPTTVRLATAITGACAGLAAFGAARGLPGLAAPLNESWTEPTALAGLAVLFAIIGGAITVAALDFGLQHRAGRVPLAGAVCGIIAGAVVEPLLGLRAAAMLIALIALPIVGGLAGMATGLAVAAGGRARRVALAGLGVIAIGIVAAGTVYAPSAEALRVRVLINQAAERNEEGRKALDQLREVTDPSAIRSLASGLQEDEGEVARACASALSNIDDRRARSALLGVLDSDNHLVRQAAVRGIIKGKDERALAPLQAMLTGEDEGATRHAAWGLSGLGDTGLAVLLETAHSTDAGHRRRALLGLGRLVETRPEARDAILAALKDSDASVRASALTWLDDIGGDEAFDRTNAMLGDPAQEVKSAAIKALARMKDPRAVDALTAALMTGDRSVQQAAADGLGKIGTPEAIAALTRATKSTDADIVRRAANGLGHAGTAEAVAILRDMLIEEALTDSHSGMAANALFNKPDLDPSLIVPLIAHEDERVRTRAGDVLWVLVADRPELVTPYLGHERAQTRAIAMQVLKACKESVDPAVAVPLLRDPDENVRAGAHHLVSTIGARAVPALTEALTDPDAELATQAVTALGEIGDKRAVEPLTEAFRGGQPTVRLAAARALGQLGATELTDEFIRMLETGDGPARVAAATALGALKDPRGMEPLIAALSDTNADARAAAAEALGAIGEPAVAPLIELVDSKDEWIRHGAREALGRIDNPDAKRALEEAQPGPGDIYMDPPMMPGGP